MPRYRTVLSSLVCPSKIYPDHDLAAMYYKERVLELPPYMASIGAEGGIVSTAAGLGRFTEGFFDGALFDAERFESLYDWRLLLAPGVCFHWTGIARQPV